LYTPGSTINSSLKYTAKLAIMNRHVILDRDGVINRDSPTAVLSLEQFQFLPGVFEALRLLNENGFRVHIVSNQSAVGRGRLSGKDLNRITQFMVEKVRQNGGDFETIQYCIHRPGDGCRCRKPQPGMLLNLKRLYNIDLAQTFVIGDKPIDVECADKTGARTVLLNSGLTRYDWSTMPPEQQKPEFIAENLLEAVKKIVLNNIKGTDHELCRKIS